MGTRTLSRVIQSHAVSEGAGVTVRRSIGTPGLRHFDPFLMLDHFGSDNPNEYIAGFPDHPHRGFVTLTYMLNGHMQHKDSMGNQGDLRAGGAQWMKAASGVIHSEMPMQTQGLMRGFQLWINLPSHQKMSNPEYQEFSPEAIKEINRQGTRVRILAGRYDDLEGPIQDPFTRVCYLDVQLDPNVTFKTSLTPTHNAFLFMFEGSARMESTTLASHSLAILNNGEDVSLLAGDQGARFILVSGQPLGEPIVQYGPFVMNTRAEIEQAFADYHAGRLVQVKANFREL